MNKWKIILKEKTIEFDSFENALTTFLKTINNYFWDHSNINKDATDILVFDSSYTPNAINTLFSHLYDERKITDEEIILHERLGMLLTYFGCSKPHEIKANALKTINKSYDYHYQDDEIGFQVDIKINYSPEEIVVDLGADYGDSILSTNAFIMDNENKTYYFKSHQTCFVSTNGSDLDKTADLEIVLEKN